MPYRPEFWTNNDDEQRRQQALEMLQKGLSKEDVRAWALRTGAISPSMDATISKYVKPAAKVSDEDYNAAITGMPLLPRDIDVMNEKIGGAVKGAAKAVYNLPMKGASAPASPVLPEPKLPWSLGTKQDAEAETERLQGVGDKIAKESLPFPGPHKSLEQAPTAAIPETTTAEQAKPEEKLDLDYFKKQRLIRDFMETGRDQETATKLAEQFLALQKQKETEANVATEEQDKSLKSQRLIRNLSKGVGQIGQGLASLGSVKHGGLGIPQQEVTTPILDEEIGLKEQQVSPAARNMVKQVFGVDVPENYTWAQLKQTLGPVGDLIQSRTGADLRAAQMASLEDQREFNRDVKLRAEGRLPEAAAKDLTNIKTALSAVDDAERRWNDAGGLGPVTGRVQAVLRKFGLNDPQAAATNAQIKETFLKYMYGVGGKQLSDKEMAAWEDAMFSSYDSDATFKQLIDKFRQNLVRQHNEILETQAAQGRNVEPHRQGVAKWANKKPQYKVGDIFEGKKIIAIDPENPNRIQVAD